MCDPDGEKHIKETLQRPHTCHARTLHSPRNLNSFSQSPREGVLAHSGPNLPIFSASIISHVSLFLFFPIMWLFWKSGLQPHVLQCKATKPSRPFLTLQACSRSPIINVASSLSYLLLTTSEGYLIDDIFCTSDEGIFVLLRTTSVCVCLKLSFCTSWPVFPGQKKPTFTLACAPIFFNLWDKPWIYRTDVWIYKLAVVPYIRGFCVFFAVRGYIFARSPKWTLLEVGARLRPVSCPASTFVLRWQVRAKVVELLLVLASFSSLIFASYLQVIS